MFSSMHLMGFGPHDDVSVELTPGGVTHIHGPSECGKSSLLTALCLVLWGVDEHGSRRDLDQLVRDGHDAAELMLSTPRATYGRTVKRRGQAKRWRTQGDVVERFRSEQEWRNALGPVGRVLVADGREVEAGRLVVAPRAWLALAEGAGGGRALRDVLEQATLLPDEDPDAALRAAVAELLGGLDERETHDQRTAEEQRTETRRAVAQAEGALRTAGVQLEATKAAAPKPLGKAEREAAEHTVMLADAWLGYRTDQAKAEALMRWTVTDPGDEPERVEMPDLVALRARYAEGRQALTEALHRGETCPTCQRDGWHRSAEDSAEVAELRAALEEAERAGSAGREQADKAAAHARWVERMALRGERPPEPMGLDQPGEPEPTPGEVEQARALLLSAREVDGAQRQHRKQVKAAEARVKDADEALVEAQRKAQRADALVEAIRKAPGVLLRQRLDRLGDLGPVSLEVVGEGVRVLVNGRPWHRASTGAQLHADVWLRLALRRVLRMPWLPLVVDDRGRWSGELPELGRAWVFRTTAREGLVSSAATSGREAA